MRSGVLSFVAAAVGNGVGGVLAAIALTAARSAATRRGRLALVAVAVWALTESAQYDLVLVLSGGLSDHGVLVRYDLVPILVTTAVSLVVGIPVFFVAVGAREPVSSVVLGLAAGCLVFVGCQQTIGVINAGASIDVRRWPFVVISVISSIAIAGALLAGRWLPRGRVAIAAAVFTIGLGVAQYATLTSMSFGPSTPGPVGAGITSIDTVIPTLMAFLVRVIVLAVVSLTVSTQIRRRGPEIVGAVGAASDGSAPVWRPSRVL